MIGRPLQRPFATFLPLFLIATGAGNLTAQGVTVSWGAQAVPAFTVTNIVPGDRSLGEVRVVMPVGMLHADAFGGRLRLVATANFEKYTIPNGELAPGDWGESFEDRRHPHTLVHELMLTAPGAHVFVAAGKGFVPFGTDDPMLRPTVRFPVKTRSTWCGARCDARRSSRRPGSGSPQSVVGYSIRRCGTAESAAPSSRSASDLRPGCGCTAWASTSQSQ